MRRTIFILSSVLCVCGIQNATASDYLEEEPIVEPVADNVQISDAKYISATVDEVAKTRARIDELLIPNKTCQNLWTDGDCSDDDSPVQAVIMTPGERTASIPHKAKFDVGDQTYYGETVYIVNNFLYGAGNAYATSDNVSETSGAYAAKKMSTEEYFDCPFNTATECAVWLRKPIISESVAPRSKTLRDSVMCDVSTAIEDNPNISANDKRMKPLLNRYNVLMRASRSCCTGGMTHKLKQAGASQGLIYKFLADDVNFSGFGSRCLVMSDEQIENTDKYEATSATVADVRNGCLCKSKGTFKALLAPFAQLYKDYPEFAKSSFEYKHYDGVGRAVTDSVNTDVQNVLSQLEMCP